MAEILNSNLEHPIEILKKEHELIIGFSDQLKEIAEKIQLLHDFNAAESLIQQLQTIAGNCKDSASHYMREENVLFPTLDKMGIKEPPKIMWMEHDRIREIEKNLYSLIDNCDNMPFRRFSEQLRETALNLAEMLAMHFHKENNILFTMAEKVIGEGEMEEIKKQFDKMGYCC